MAKKATDKGTEAMKDILSPYVEDMWTQMLDIALGHWAYDEIPIDDPDVKGKKFRVYRKEPEPRYLIYCLDRFHGLMEKPSERMLAEANIARIEAEKKSGIMEARPRLLDAQTDLLISQKSYAEKAAILPEVFENALITISSSVLSFFDKVPSSELIVMLQQENGNMIVKDRMRAIIDEDVERIISELDVPEEERGQEELSDEVTVIR
jgi:hypothetical protein